VIRREYVRVGQHVRLRQAVAELVVGVRRVVAALRGPVVDLLGDEPATLVVLEVHRVALGAVGTERR
jgi:hypothetical protein